MCLRDIDNKEIKRKVSKLPKIFPVWKVMFSSEHPYQTEYDYAGLSLLKDGINIAENDKGTYSGFSVRTDIGPRAHIPYTPGFHAYIRKKDVMNCCSWRTRKFWAKKEWVTTVGFANNTVINKPCVVLSKISTTKEAILDEQE